MHCEHCKETINRFLLERFDNISVSTDLDQHEVSITYTNGNLNNLNDSSLREALIEIGYKPEE